MSRSQGAHGQHPEPHKPSKYDGNGVPAGLQPLGPRVVARRLVQLASNRVLDLCAIADSEGRIDVWVAQRHDGHLVSRFRLKPSMIRVVASALDAIAGELGQAP